MSEMQASFLLFCNSQKKGSIRASDKVMKKLFTDSGVFQLLGLTACDMDIAVAAFKGKEKIKGDMTFDQFCQFLKHFCSEAAKRGKVAAKDTSSVELEIKEIIAASKPVAHGATTVSRDAATTRLTDVKGYTGQHKERFDADTGQGKGREGRLDVADRRTTQGYVAGYKGVDTYDKK